MLGKATVAAPNGRDLANDTIARIVTETKKAVHKKVTIRFTINDGVTVLDEKGAVYTQSRIHKVTGWYIHETEQEGFCFIFKGEVSGFDLQHIIMTTTPYLIPNLQLASSLDATEEYVCHVFKSSNVCLFQALNTFLMIR